MCEQLCVDCEIWMCWLLYCVHIISYEMEMVVIRETKGKYNSRSSQWHSILCRQIYLSNKKKQRMNQVYQKLLSIWLQPRDFIIKIYSNFHYFVLRWYETRSTFEISSYNVSYLYLHGICPWEISFVFLFFLCYQSRFHFAFKFNHLLIKKTSKFNVLNAHGASKLKSRFDFINK